MSMIMGLSMSALALHYTVEQGDTLSSIAEVQFPGRIYGENGNLKKFFLSIQK